MAQKDREKWNRKFSEMPDLLAPRPPSQLVEKYFPKAPGKRALDLACGGGRHTLFLSQKGFDVDAVDISAVALEKLAQKVDPKSVKLIETDLDDFVLHEERYDLIVKTNFLDRDLIERAKKALKKGAVMIVETYLADDANEKRDSNPDFLLQKGELEEIFSDGFEILEYREFWNETYEKYRMKKAAIAVKRL